MLIDLKDDHQFIGRYHLKWKEWLLLRHLALASV